MQSIPPPLQMRSGTNLGDVLEELESSDSIYFVQPFSSAEGVHLTLPLQFVQEHGYRIDRWVILRIRTSAGTSSRPWVVKIEAHKKPDGTRFVHFSDGWESFTTHNQVQEGDSFIFLLSREGVRSEFEVYVFREIGGSVSMLELLEEEEEEEKEEEKEEEGLGILDSGNSTSPVSDPKSNVPPCPALPKDEDVRTITGNSSASKASGSQQAEQSDSVFPSFRKRMSASCIQRSSGKSNSGQFEFPVVFANTYGERLLPAIQLQGIYEKSPVYLVACNRNKGWPKPKEFCRLRIKDSDWNAFVKENKLQKGHVLEFSLTADSHFEVRKV